MNKLIIDGTEYQLELTGTGSSSATPSVIVGDRHYVGVAVKADRNNNVLFTTEDGVDIYNMHERVFAIFDDYSKDYELLAHHTFDGINFIDGKYKLFSTEHAAESYFLMNKPCLSVNDVISNYRKWSQDLAILERELIELAKEKINE